MCWHCCYYPFSIEWLQPNLKKKQFDFVCALVEQSIFNDRRGTWQSHVWRTLMGADGTCRPLKASAHDFDEQPRGRNFEQQLKQSKNWKMQRKLLHRNAEKKYNMFFGVALKKMGENQLKRSKKKKIIKRHLELWHSSSIMEIVMWVNGKLFVVHWTNRTTMTVEGSVQNGVSWLVTCFRSFQNTRHSSKFIFRGKN